MLYLTVFASRKVKYKTNRRNPTASDVTMMTVMAEAKSESPSDAKGVQSVELLAILRVLFWKEII
jgi:hypothetical protein